MNALTMSRDIGHGRELHYLDDDAVTAVTVTPAPSSGRTVSGYGGRLPTPYLLTLADGSTRRVRAMCYGNAASHYVMVRGAVAHLDVETEHRIELAFETFILA